jgi:lipoprotein-anchoring transpeptidase ErfK/SrfK
VKFSRVEAARAFPYRSGEYDAAVRIFRGFSVPNLSFARKTGIALAAAAALMTLSAYPAAANPIEDFFRSFSTPGLYSGGQGPAWEFRRQTVSFRTHEKPGTIIIDTRSKFLFLVLGDDRAIRYGVGVGREGFGWRGTVHVGRKAEWPGWTPPKEMIARERRRGRIIPAYMPGGQANPLGARAMYLFDGGRDTMFRIHGTSEPWTIGHNVSSGCIRLVNADVIDLYNRVRVGAKVIVV